jgi:hypothetical protein
MKHLADHTKAQPSFGENSLRTSTAASIDSERLDTAEERMRHALGLRGGALPGPARPQSDRGPQQVRQRVPEAGTPHRRHRFVQDGEVPVVHVGRRPEGTGDPLPQGFNRLQAAEAAGQAERTGRERAERALQAAQAATHELQTKLGHAELALAEAQAQAKSRAAELEALRAADLQREMRLSAAEDGRRSAEQASLAANAALEVERQARRAAEQAAADAAALSKTPRAASPQDEKTQTDTVTRKTRATKRVTAQPAAREPQPVKWWLPSKSRQRSSRQSRS